MVDKHDLFREALKDLEDVYKDQILDQQTDLKKKIADVGEFIDNLKLETTGDRKCKVGCTIP